MSIRNIVGKPSEGYFLFDWSPDSSRLVFFTMSRSPDKSDIYVVNVDGSGLVKLTNSTRRDTVYMFGGWSPDGSRIAFRSSPWDGFNDIYIANVDGSRLVNVTKSSDLHEFYEFGGWSPDGSRFLFARQPEFGSNGHIFVSQADGSGLIRLTTTTRDYRLPTWSPDGSTVLTIARESKHEPYAVYRINSDNSYDEVVGMTPLKYIDQGTHVWSPNRLHVAFVVWGDESPGTHPELTIGSNLVYLLNKDGTGFRKLIDDPECCASFDWSPDDSRIVLSTINDGYIYIIDTDGSGLRRIGDIPTIAPIWLFP
jgi:Tol biopolymer transport system component